MKSMKATIAITADGTVLNTYKAIVFSMRTGEAVERVFRAEDDYEAWLWVRRQLAPHGKTRWVDGSLVAGDWDGDVHIC
jgi:hypothetical protein